MASRKRRHYPELVIVEIPTCQACHEMFQPEEHVREMSVHGRLYRVARSAVWCLECTYAKILSLATEPCPEISIVELKRCQLCDKQFEAQDEEREMRFDGSRYRVREGRTWCPHCARKRFLRAHKLREQTW